MTARCPECGSEKLGYSEVVNGGLNRFAPMCTSCKKIAQKRSPSVEALLKDNADDVLLWDKKPEPHGIWLAAPTGARMEQGTKPRVGALSLEALDGLQTPVDMRGAPFRPVEEQKRFEAGEAIGKSFHCDGCGREEQGALMADNPETRADPKIEEIYHSIPAGWYFRLPSMTLFCSAACVQEDRKVVTGIKVAWQK